jgi:transposase
MWHVGLDAHARQSTYCVLDEGGRKVRVRTIRGTWHDVVAELAQLEKPFAVCFEASLGYGYLFEQLGRIARRVVVAHPGNLRLIFRSKRKNDRVDAEKLAKLLYLDEVPPVYVPSIEIRSWRRLIEHRCRLVRERARVKNGLRAVLRNHGIVAPKRLWTRQGLRWLVSVDVGPKLDTLQRDLQLERLEAVTRMIERVEQTLDEVARAHPGVELLRTIPGVGPRTAEAVIAYIDNPDRFGRLKSIGRYFGLVPSQDASAGLNRMGHITREGAGTVRWLLTEAAWQGVRRSPRIRAFFHRVKRGDPERQKIAAVATAHYVLRIMLAMLRTGEVWRQEEVAA